MEELPNRTSIDHLRQTEYMKLLEYAVASAGRLFTREEAIAGAGVSAKALTVTLAPSTPRLRRAAGNMD